MILERIEEGLTGAEAAGRLNRVMDFVELHDVDVGANKIDIATVKGDLITVTTDVGTNTLAIEANTLAVADNTADIISNTSAIITNNTDIATVVGELSVVKTTVDEITDFLDDGITAVLDEPVVVSEDGNDILTYSSNGNVIALGDNSIATVVTTTPLTPFKVREDNAGDVQDFEIYHRGNTISTDSGNYLSVGTDGGIRLLPVYSGAGVSHFLYKYETDLVNVVGDGKITMNTNDGTTATLLHFNDTDDAGVSLTWFFESMEAGDWFNLYLRESGEDFIAFDVVSPPTREGDTWTVEVVHYSSSITEFTDRDKISVIWRQGGSSNVATQVYVDAEVAQLRAEIQQLRDYVDSLHPAP